ncbi:hypothetical protein [Natrialba taiwanensis]|uniref:Uncharacterized protein n=1 Tax=Natrialba taiwanensis DSM 12281 TaxID=1230458 RepID=L9ZW71_9EURY|nr:hypothetical protein [Natrialba taiwanensis]ELY90735.1 hypothetical protein C484_10946 [Natrialba taiwanensis DSM 12281]
MSENTRWPMARRTFVKCGAVSTGALLGTSGASARIDSTSREPETEPVDHGLLLPYQFRPGSRVTVAASELDWQPERFERSYQTNVITYDHAPSYRAFLFTEPNGILAPAQSLEFSGVERSAQAAGRGVVTVGLNFDFE